MAEAAASIIPAASYSNRRSWLSTTRVLVTGGNGLLGTKLLEQLLGRDDVVAASCSLHPCSNGFLGAFPFWQVDITSGQDVARVFAEATPDVVVHTAAMTDVDGCETDREQAWQVNVEGSRRVAEACRRFSCRLALLSTEYVFDGKAGPYPEEAEPNPIGYYGLAKLRAEQIAADVCKDWTVARTTVLYGYAPNARPNFVTWLLDRLRRGIPTPVVWDQVGSPTLADNLAAMVIAVALSGRTGVYNTVGSSVIARVDFAREVARVFDLPEGLIQPVDTASLGQPAPRPLKAGLKMDKFRREFPDVPVLSAREGLQLLRDQLFSSARG